VPSTTRSSANATVVALTSGSILRRKTATPSAAVLIRNALASRIVERRDMAVSSDILSPGYGDPIGFEGFLSILYDFPQPSRITLAGSKLVAR
jgi:hypothetical protein